MNDAVPTAMALRTPPMLARGAGRLIVVSNRAPVRVVRAGAEQRVEPTVGGVGTTFLRLLERNGGLWLAWSGGQAPPGRLALAGQARFELRLIRLSEREVSEYYYGMCNRGLWPLMHYMTPNCHFTARHWSTYQRVNQAFANAAGEEARPRDTLWIQDFHLALTPALIRAARPEAAIGVFWHVPFPPEQIFRVFPWRAELLRGMLGADLIGFHIRSYAGNFLNSCERILRLKVDRARGEVRVGERTVRVGAFALGIPIDYFDQIAAEPQVAARVRVIRSGMRSRQIVLGVDRLDYTKGILERLLGFERFLESNPRYHRRVGLTLIAVPSRTRVADYALLKRELDEQVGRINGRFSGDDWAPIHYLYTQFGPEELIAHYQAADVALLTPLRDGMNLVSKEYVASHREDDGVLILSEFAGAAGELREALLVNPYDIDQIAVRIREALDMEPRERATRMRALRRRVRANNLERWSSTFLKTLDEAHHDSHPASHAAFSR